MADITAHVGVPAEFDLVPLIKADLPIGSYDINSVTQLTAPGTGWTEQISGSAGSPRRLSGVAFSAGTWTATYKVVYAEGFEQGTFTLNMTVAADVELPAGATVLLDPEVPLVALDLKWALAAQLAGSVPSYGYTMTSGAIDGVTVAGSVWSGTPAPGVYQVNWQGRNNVNEKFNAQWAVHVAGDDPGPDPDPEPGELVAEIAAKVAAVLDIDSTRATAAVEQVILFVRAYTRGRGFTDDRPADDLLAVCTSASIRHANNPALLRSFAVADYSEVGGGLDGFTIPELAVLHQYRRRTC